MEAGKSTEQGPTHSGIIGTAKMGLKDKGAIDRILVAAIVIGLALSVVFGLGALRGARRMRGARHQASSLDTQQIQGWMTVPYIAKVYHLDPAELYRAASIPSLGSDSKSLQALNRELFPGQQGLVYQRIQEAVRLGLQMKVQRGKDRP